MKRKSKIILAITVLFLIAGGIWGGIRWSRRDLVTVQTGIAARGDLVSIVTASGEIKPRNYINLGANAQGPITALLVKEGDRVRRGQVVARIEQIQANADVQAQRAAVASTLADYNSAEAAVRENAAHLAQMQSQRAQVAAQLAASQRRVTQAQAGEIRLSD